MTYEEVKQLSPGTLVKVIGCVYDFMFLEAVAPIMVENNGLRQVVDPSQIKPLTVYDTAMIKRMYEAVFTDEDTRFNKVVEFIEKLK